MTYSNYEFTAFTEADLLPPGDHDLGVGDTFIVPTFATTCISVSDNDIFLSGDSSKNEQANDHSGQQAQIEGADGSELGNGNQIYAERYYVVEDSDGNTYKLVEVEQEGADGDYFTFYNGDGGSTPPAGAELTLVSSHNVTTNFLDYKCLDAGVKEWPIQDCKYSIEAEDMHLSGGFDDVHGDSASGGSLVKLKDGHDGALSTEFGGAGGRYDIVVHAQDETDGASLIKVFVNGHEVGTIELSGQETTAGSDDHGFSEFTLSGIEISTGDEVVFEAWRDSGEYVRIDKIEFCEDKATATIAGRFTYDADRNDNEFNDLTSDFDAGIEGETVNLIDADTGAVVATTTTDGDGAYSFAVEPGDYKVEFPSKAGFEFSDKDSGVDDSFDSDANPDGETDVITVADGETVSDVDAGLKQVFRECDAPGAVKIDFEGFAAGTVIDTEYDGVTIEAQRNGSDNTDDDDAMVFDALDPTGNDSDLATPTSTQGNVLIISEDNDSGDPDDNSDGGRIFFRFDNPSYMFDIKVIDAEEGGFIDMFDADGNLLNCIVIPAGVNGGIQQIVLDQDDVATLKVRLTGSGAIDDLCYVPGEEIDPVCAVDDVITVFESEGAGDLDGNVLANDVAGSVSYEGAVVSVDGQTANVGEWIDLADGGRVRILQNGDVDFDANGAFDDLDVGETDTVTVTYSIEGTGTVGDDLIVNGSFEDLTGTQSTGYGRVSQDGTLVGWTDLGGEAIDLHNDERGGAVAPDGHYWLDLDASPGNNAVAQTVQGIEDGKSYELRFQMAESQPLQPSDIGTDICRKDKKLPFDNKPVALTVTYSFGTTLEQANPTSKSKKHEIDNFGADDDGTVFIRVTGKNSDDVLFEGVVSEGESFVIENDGDKLDKETNFEIYDFEGGPLLQEVEMHTSCSAPLAIGDQFGSIVLDGATLGGGDQFGADRPGSSVADDQGVDVYWGGELVFSGDPASNAFEEVVLNLTGGAGDGSNQLVFVGTGTLDNFGAAVDTVSLRQIDDTEATVNIVVQGEANNVAPVANNDLVFMQEDTVAIFDVRSNDTDGDGDMLTLVSFGDVVDADGVVRGTLVRSALDSNVLEFTPEANYFGNDIPVTFDYTITDGNGEFATATVEIRISQVSDAPVGDDQDITTDEDVAFSGQLTASDIENDPFFFGIGNNGPTNGSVIINDDGSYVYTPDADYNGPDSFEYIVFELGGIPSSTATVTITVTPVNDAPVAQDGAATGDENSTISGAVVATDVDDDDTTLVFTLLGDASNGSVAMNTDGTFSYAPSADYNGSDSFTYEVRDIGGLVDTGTVALTVNAVDSAPVAADGTASGDEDTTITGAVVATDVDDDDSTLVYTLLGDGSNGSVVMNTDGTFSYTPVADYNGSDSFTYEVRDPSGLVDTGTVTLTINAVNDAPVAQDGTATGDENSTIAGSVIATDVDDDDSTLSFTLLGDASNGSVVMNTDGTFSYTPTANYNGADSFTYEVRDVGGLVDTGTVALTVNAVNTAPTASDGSASGDEDTTITGAVVATDVDDDDTTLVFTLLGDASNGTVTVNTDGTFSYAPNTNFNGTDTFTYTVADPGGLTDTGTVTLTVNAVNDAPDAQDGSASGDEDTTITGSVTAIDPDDAASTLTFSLLGDPSNGSVVMNADGTFSYDPVANFNGTDTFTYEVTDPSGLIDTGTVTVTVNSVNDTPVANMDIYFMQEDTELVFDPTSNDTDIDGDALILIGFTDVVDQDGVVRGTLTPTPFPTNPNALTFVPEQDYFGNDVPVTFEYTVLDTAGGVSTGTVEIKITQINDKPEADTLEFDIDPDTTLSAQLVATDVDSTDLDYSLFGSAPANGTLVIDNDTGAFTYTPDAGFVGTDTFNYLVDDNDGQTNIGFVTIFV